MVYGQLKEERFAQIDYENRLMLDKMNEIMKRKSRYNQPKLKKRHSTNLDCTVCMHALLAAILTRQRSPLARRQALEAAE